MNAEVYQPLVAAFATSYNRDPRARLPGVTIWLGQATSASWKTSLRYKFPHAVLSLTVGREDTQAGFTLDNINQLDAEVDQPGGQRTAGNPLGLQVVTSIQLNTEDLVQLGVKSGKDKIGLAVGGFMNGQNFSYDTFEGQVDTPQALSKATTATRQILTRLSYDLQAQPKTLPN